MTVSLFPYWYHSSRNISVGNTPTKITVPPLQVRVDDTSLESLSNITLDVNSDSSWDFGQNISTWQPNTTYSVGDWVRPTLATFADGSKNNSTAYATTLMTANSMPDRTVASASSEYSTYLASGAFNQSTSGTLWEAGAAGPYYLKYDFGVGKERVINKFRYLGYSSYSPKTFTFDGSNDNSNWTTLYTGNNVADSGSIWTSYFTFSNSTAYRYYRIYITASWTTADCIIRELHIVAQPSLVFRASGITTGVSNSSEPSWAVTGDTTDSGVTWTVYTDYTLPLNRTGQDSYIYSVIPTLGHTPKLLLSANATYPHGYDATNSRKIGGFHCLCANVGTIANHPLTGYVSGDILPTSVWDLKHRCANHNNAGMVYDDVTGKWYAIYLPSLSGSNAVSVYNATISDALNWWAAVDYCANSSTRLLKDHEFTACATGSPENTAIFGAADPVTTGGHVNTGGVRIISHIGCEDCVGVLISWLDETVYGFYNDTNHTHSLSTTGELETATSGVASADVAPVWGWKNITGGKGQLYVQGDYTCKLVAGGLWSQSIYCGSLSRYYNIWIQEAQTYQSYRFCCESKEL